MFWEGDDQAKAQRIGKELLGRDVEWQEHGEMQEPPLGLTAGSLRAVWKDKMMGLGGLGSREG